MTSTSSLPYSIASIARALEDAGDTTYSRNAGQRREYVLRFAYTGECHKADHVKFDEGSDIDTSSVKSSAATLCPWHGNTLADAIDWYLAHDVSDTYVYISADYMVYTMDEDEFRNFLLQRAYKDHDSRTKCESLRIKKESNPQLSALQMAIIKG